MLDLTDRIIQPAKAETPLRVANGSLRWHAPRRVLQLLCGALFVALPLTNGLRLDVRRDEFYFVGHKMAAHDLALLFWVAMLGVSLLVTVSYLYGRLWCGWVCPQTLASDFADSLKARLEKAGRHFGPQGVRASLALWVFGVAAVSVATGVILACYWLAPSAVWAATLAPGRDVSAGLTVYGLAAVLLADMLWVRRRFCSHLCPYGPLLSTLSDRNTLAVRYLDERQGDCIGCHRCETDCPMGIDIKRGVGQHGCIGCGECIDSCNDVLGRRGKPGLIEFRYGTDPDRVTKALPPAKRVGLWDATRVSVALTVPLCLGVTLFLIYGHLPLAASLNANGAVVRTPDAVRDTYALTLGNGGPATAVYRLSVSGLPGGAVEPATVTVGGHDRRTVPVTLVGLSRGLTPGRMPVRLGIRGGDDMADLRTIFYTPAL